MTTPPATRDPRDNAGRRRALIFALVAVTVGGWLLLDSSGVEVPSFARLWPIFLVIGGVASLVDWFLGRRPASAGQAVIGIGLGALFFTVTYGVTRWRDVLDWLPSLPTVFGLAMIVTWLASARRGAHLLAFGVTLLVLGVLGFAARYEALRELLPSAQLVWAVALLVAGLVIGFAALRRR